MDSISAMASDDHWMCCSHRPFRYREMTAPSSEKERMRLITSQGSWGKIRGYIYGEVSFSAF